MSGNRPRFFQPSISVGELAGGPALFVDVFGFEQLLEQAQLIVVIENGKAGFEAREFIVVAQDLDADGVEGAEPCHAFDHAADQHADALFHLARGLVGEGDGEDLIGPGLAGGEHMGEAGGEHAGLAGAGTCEHQQGAVDGEHSIALFGVQALEILRFGCGHGAGGQATGCGLVRFVVKVSEVERVSGHSKNMGLMGESPKGPYSRCSYSVLVIPAKAGIFWPEDSGFRRNDGDGVELRCAGIFSRFAGDRTFEIAHFLNRGLPVGSHIGVALFQAEFRMANGFVQGLGAVSKDKGFSEVLVSIVCHVSLLVVVVRFGMHPGS